MKQRRPTAIGTNSRHSTTMSLDSDPSLVKFAFVFWGVIFALLLLGCCLGYNCYRHVGGKSQGEFNRRMDELANDPWKKHKFRNWLHDTLNKD